MNQVENLVIMVCGPIITGVNLIALIIVFQLVANRVDHIETSAMILFFGN